MINFYKKLLLCMVLKLLALWNIALFPYIDNLVVVYKCVKIYIYIYTYKTL